LCINTFVNWNQTLVTVHQYSNLPPPHRHSPVLPHHLDPQPFFDSSLDAMQNQMDKQPLGGSPPSVHSSPLNPNSFNIMPGSEASTRRQRIAMACQYCRHRYVYRLTCNRPSR
jgi:hypothetical protein